MHVYLIYAAYASNDWISLSWKFRKCTISNESNFCVSAFLMRCCSKCSLRLFFLFNDASCFTNIAPYNRYFCNKLSKCTRLLAIFYSNFLFFYYLIRSNVCLSSTLKVCYSFFFIVFIFLLIVSLTFCVRAHTHTGFVGSPIIRVKPSERHITKQINIKWMNSSDFLYRRNFYQIIFTVQTITHMHTAHRKRKKKSFIVHIKSLELHYFIFSFDVLRFEANGWDAKSLTLV